MIQREENWFRVLLPSVNKKYSEQEGCGFIATCLVLKHALSSDPCIGNIIYVQLFLPCVQLNCTH
jgi:hypothetical protein